MADRIKPISPDEIQERKAETIPDEIIQAVNELIAMKWNGSSATIRKDDLLNRYFELTQQENNQRNRAELYDKHALDIEHVFRQVGWSVSYDQPSYGDSDYEPYWDFKRKK